MEGHIRAHLAVGPMSAQPANRARGKGALVHGGERGVVRAARLSATSRMTDPVRRMSGPPAFFWSNLMVLQQTKTSNEASSAQRR